MAQKMIAFFFVQAVIFQTVYSQVIGRFGGCGCSNILPMAEQIINPYLPGPTYLPPSPTYLPPNQIMYDQPTTIIQDSTVANNLANALQLLVVSNLLSSALPLDQPAPLAISAANLAPLAVAAPNLAPLEYLPGSYVNAPLSMSSFSPCGCGGCGCNGCGLGAFNMLY